MAPRDFLDALARADAEAWRLLCQAGIDPARLAAADVFDGAIRSLADAAPHEADALDAKDALRGLLTSPAALAQLRRLTDAHVRHLTAVADAGFLLGLAVGRYVRLPPLPPASGAANSPAETPLREVNVGGEG